MNSVVLSQKYDEPAVCEREILRYAGCKESDANITEILHSCLKELNGKFDYKVCYCVLSVNIKHNICDFGVFSLESKDLAKNLNGCKNVILFAATVGVGIDRMITKYGRLSVSKALIFQAIGAERIEALCDAFCADMSNEMNVALRPRFSPGYGDLPIDTQKKIFSVLDCGKKIGLSLNDSLLMSPTKSVTAFVGVNDKY